MAAPKNIRVSASRPKTGRDLAQQSAAAPRAGRSAKAPSIQDEIHRLECFISAAPRIARQHKLARMNIVPPHEFETPRFRRQPAGGRLPLQHQLAIRRRRQRLLLELGAVILGIAGLAGWMNQYLHFIR